MGGPISKLGPHPMNPSRPGNSAEIDIISEGEMYDEEDTGGGSISDEESSVPGETPEGAH